MTLEPSLRAISGCMLAAALTACEASDVGAPCVPEEEYVDDFSGFSLGEVNFESRSFQCESRLCLVNGFRGRVSCPYGQSESDARGDPQCFVPGSRDPIHVAVEPQILDRRPDDAVYCSCRCDGPDPDARYCDCPSGFVCARLVPDVGSRSIELTGSYCIRRGSEYDRSRVSTAEVCDRSRASCE